MKNSSLFAIVLNYNDYHNTSRLAKCLSRFSIIEKVIIVDNNSKENIQNIQNLNSEKIEVLMNNSNNGYGGGNNFGIKYVKNKYNSKYCLVINPDVYVEEKTIENLYAFLVSNSNYAVCSCFQKDIHGNSINRSAWMLPNKFLYMKTIFLSAKKMNKFFYLNDNIILSNKIVDVDCVAGAMLMVRVEDFLSAGGYDENIFLYCEETVLGFRIKAINKKTAILSDSFYIHAHGETIKKTFSKSIQTKKLLLVSHKYVFRNYFSHNKLLIFLDSLYCSFSLNTSRLKNLLSNKKRNANGK